MEYVYVQLKSKKEGEKYVIKQGKEGKEGEAQKEVWKELLPGTTREVVHNYGKQKRGGVNKSNGISKMKF